MCVMCIQWHRRCCCHAKHPELIPSNIAAFCFFCVCLLLLFSLFHFLIMLFNYYYYFFFCTFVFSRFCALSKFEMLTKMVVNAKNKHTRTHTHFFCTMPLHSIWLWFRYDANTFWLLQCAYIRLHKYSITLLFHLLLLCEHRFSVWTLKDNNTIIIILYEITWNTKKRMIYSQQCNRAIVTSSLRFLL